MNKYEIHQEFYYYNEWQTVRVFDEKFETFEAAEKYLLDLGLIPVEDFYQLEGEYLLSHNEYARPTYNIVKVGDVVCPKCLSDLETEKDKDIDYPYVCKKCDENFFAFECQHRQKNQNIHNHQE
jgi:hypothetical protein